MVHVSDVPLQFVMGLLGTHRLHEALLEGALIVEALPVELLALAGVNAGLNKGIEIRVEEVIADFGAPVQDRHLMQLLKDLLDGLGSWLALADILTSRSDEVLGCLFEVDHLLNQNLLAMMSKSFSMLCLECT